MRIGFRMLCTTMIKDGKSDALVSVFLPSANVSQFGGSPSVCILGKVDDLTPLFKFHEGSNMLST